MIAFFKRYRPVIIFSSLVLLVVVLSLTSIYFYQKYNRVSIDPNQASQAEVKALVTEVSKVMILPENELPTVATVSDPDALKNQVFFLKAKKGDKVLIFTNAKTAILYDPVVKKIVNVAPINLGETGPTIKE